MPVLSLSFLVGETVSAQSAMTKTDTALVTSSRTPSATSKTSAVETLYDKLDSQLPARRGARHRYRILALNESEP
jgi:hypothetical protein